MATSSIFANMDIRDPEKAEAFVRALELSEKDLQSNLQKELPRCEYVTDPERLHELFADRIEKYGMSQDK